MAVRARNAATPWAVFASSAGVAALLVACLLSESGANFANAQPAPAGDPDWVAQMLQTTDSVGAETDAQPAPADLGWVEQLMPNSDWSAQDASAQGPPAEIPPAQIPPAQGEPPADDPDSDDQDEEDDSRPEFAGEIDPEDSEGQAEPDWGAQMQSILQQVANRTFLSSFGQIFASFFQSEQLYIDQDATLLIPTNVGYWRYETQWDTLTRKQKRRLLRYHILKGRYTTQQLLDAAPLTLFPTFNQNLPVNKTLKPNEVYFQSVPPTRFVSPLSVPNAGLTDNIAAHGMTMVLIPPNLN
ncbi:unnamed protein product [Closterium sp. Naga37s-1]|nr:unnamed protein product [Closterium sp. Naga37s-1]